MTQLRIEIPNPEDWVDRYAAADLLGCSRTTVHDMVVRGLLHEYRLGRRTVVLWRPEVQRVADARNVLGRVR